LIIYISPEAKLSRVVGSGPVVEVEKTTTIGGMRKAASFGFLWSDRRRYSVTSNVRLLQS